MYLYLTAVIVEYYQVEIKRVSKANSCILLAVIIQNSVWGRTLSNVRESENKLPQWDLGAKLRSGFKMKFQLTKTFCKCKA